jgi:hypothetical protein
MEHFAVEIEVVTIAVVFIANYLGHIAKALNKIADHIQ